ncbi:MAG: ABC transporter permease [Haliscomenobacter sp.]|uniref:ABC transporter permease n=1 Tax=Haliscomenobacter sp. TaxID=2717303 RepID=UPI0029AF8A88|nr:ABC transporter permease [Haliscomenobacter sp.]MDX2072114.1 ABC transporter permease [Haliscomenobacter sp.]
MLTTALKIALRNFQKNRLYTLINISGLAVGLAATWLIGLFVLHERSYDNFVPDVNRICAVGLDLKFGEEEGLTTNTPPPLGPRILQDFPEVETAARTFFLQETVVRRETRGQAPLVFNENTAYGADTAFLELFDFPMLQGNASTALDRSNTVVLSERMAEKYFGKKSPMGQPLFFNDTQYTVTGVAKNLPLNSTVRFDFLLSMSTFKVVENFAWSWIWLQVDTWVKLREAVTPEKLAALEAKFPTMVKAHAPAAYNRIGIDLLAQLKKGDRYNVKLFPLNNLHLGQALQFTRLTTLGNGKQVRTYALIGGLILLLACVNFMNLATARSMQRAREVGVRKALGSQRGTLVGQFLAESLFFSFIAWALAFVLAAVALPLFNQLTGMQMGLSGLLSLKVLGIGLLLTCVAGLLGGTYPAFFLSRFKVTEIFRKMGSSTRGGHAGVRNGLVVFQFAVSVSLMLGSWVVYQQLQFALKQSPGLQRENVMIMPMLRNLEEPGKMEAFRQRLLQISEVKAASHSTFLPSVGSFGDYYEPDQGNQKHAVIKNLALSSFLTDADFIQTLGIEIIQGRGFYASNSQSDSTSVILNEAAVKTIGWEDPIGKWLTYPGNDNQRFQVVGVMRDFHSGTIRAAIEPAAIFHESSKTYRTWASYMSLRLAPGSEKAVIGKTKALWAKEIPGAPFDYDFLDDSFGNLYQEEQRAATLLGVFTALALFIGCLGLFALAAYTAEQRTKEIGIRKVLGASVFGITTLLAKDFLKLVLLAILIASPVAWYFMNQWLAEFAYRINMQWWMFAVAGVVAVGIAFLTIGFQSVKAALANPVKSLRSE